MLHSIESNDPYINSHSDKPAIEEIENTENPDKSKSHKQKIKWGNAIAFATLHTLALISFVIFIGQIKFATVCFLITVGVVGGFGVTAGAHRLYSHKSYKAKPQLEVLLLLLYSIAGQNPMFHWVRDHRVHHRYSETDADPHNAKRGFFFSQCGWLLQTKHPEVIRKGASVDMSDIINNPYIRLHGKFFVPLQLTFCFVLPSIIPPLLWNEDWTTAFWSNVVRYCVSLNFVWLVNSAAHLYGNRPYKADIGPAQNGWVNFLAIGEGYHNYHHIFPWDYKNDELGFQRFNISTSFIDLFASIGWAYDLKQPTDDLIKSMAVNFGDNTHPYYKKKSL